MIIVYVGSLFSDVIRLGEWDLSTDVDCTTKAVGLLFCGPQPAQDVKYEEIVVHPTYNKNGLLSDNIALIRLADPIDFKKNWMIRPVCLPERNFDVQAASDRGTATVTGWNFKGKLSNTLLKEYLANVDVERCNIHPRFVLQDGQICFETRSDVLCGGDYGAPVVMHDLGGSKFIQVGMFSHRLRPCEIHEPMVFTSVVSYRDWIEQALKQH